MTGGNDPRLPVNAAMASRNALRMSVPKGSSGSKPGTTHCVRPRNRVEAVGGLDGEPGRARNVTGLLRAHGDLVAVNLIEVTEYL